MNYRKMAEMLRQHIDAGNDTAGLLAYWARLGKDIARIQAMADKL